MSIFIRDYFRYAEPEDDLLCRLQRQGQDERPKEVFAKTADLIASHRKVDQAHMDPLLDRRISVIGKVD